MLTVSLWSILQTERQCECCIVLKELGGECIPPQVIAILQHKKTQVKANTLFTLSLTRPSPKLPSPVWPWPGEPSDLHWLGKSCIVGELSHLHLT